MKLPSTKQIVRAWYSITTEYSVRTNKARAQKDGKPYEVIALFDAPIDDSNPKVIGAFADHGRAMDYAESLEDDASAKAVLRLLIGR